VVVSNKSIDIIYNNFTDENSKMLAMVLVVDIVFVVLETVESFAFLLFDDC